MLVLVCVPISTELATTLTEVMPVGRRSGSVGSESWRSSAPLFVHAAANERVATQIRIGLTGPYQTLPPSYNCTDHMDL